jgi:hypothetical protein
VTLRGDGACASASAPEAALLCGDHQRRLHRAGVISGQRGLSALGILLQPSCFFLLRRIFGDLGAGSIATPQVAMSPVVLLAPLPGRQPVVAVKT